MSNRDAQKRIDAIIANADLLLAELTKTVDRMTTLAAQYQDESVDTE